MLAAMTQCFVVGVLEKTASASDAHNPRVRTRSIEEIYKMDTEAVPLLILKRFDVILFIRFISSEASENQYISNKLM